MNLVTYPVPNQPSPPCHPLERGPVSEAEMLHASKASECGVRKVLGELMSLGLVERVDRGVYQLTAFGRADAAEERAA